MPFVGSQPPFGLEQKEHVLLAGDRGYELGALG